MKTALLLLGFWALQVLAYSAFKYGSRAGEGRRGRWLAGFLGGNLVGIASTSVLMAIYQEMPDNCNVALMLASGGAFICCQVVLAVLFRSRLNLRQWSGVALVAVGSGLAALAP